MTRVDIQPTVPPREILQTSCATNARFDAGFAGGIDGSFAPSFEIQDLSRQFVVKADIPGVAPADLEIYIDKGWITVCGRRADRSRAAKYRAYERTFGSFWRAFRLGQGIVAESARAKLERGVLTVLVPKPVVLSSASGRELDLRTVN